MDLARLIVLLFAVVCFVSFVPLFLPTVLTGIHALDAWEHDMGSQQRTKTGIRDDSYQAHRVVPGWHGRKMFREDVTRLALGVTIVQSKKTFLKQVMQP